MERQCSLVVNLEIAKALDIHCPADSAVRLFHDVWIHLLTHLFNYIATKIIPTINTIHAILNVEMSTSD